MFALFIDKHAVLDIQDAIDYYNSITSGLGKRISDVKF
jgi:hypothetical protein